MRHLLWVVVGVALNLSQAPPRTIALTFDDLPASQGSEEVDGVTTLNSAIVSALQAHRAPAVGFVNEGKLTNDNRRERQIEALRFFEGLSRDTFDREVAQILLVHVNDINADYLPAMLDKMKGRGYAFVSLAEAMKDAAYRTPDDYIGNAGPSWLHRWRVAKGLPSKLTAEPDPPTWVIDLYRRR